MRRTIYSIFLVFLTTLLFSTTARSQCSANFTSSVSGSTATFTNTSVNNVYNTWYFGDGTSSSMWNPSHTYSTAGTYTVCLIITDSLQLCTDSICKSITIASSGSGCQAAFTHTTSGLTASMTNTSTGTTSGTSYSYNMGNGTTQYGPNPSYTYPQAGTYIVCLTISDSSSNCLSTSCDTVIVSGSSGGGCQAAFTHTTSGLTASFTNTSTGTTGGTSYSYNMGNGSFQFGPNPSYTYPQAGTYIVCLTISDSSSSCSSTYCDTVVVSGSSGGNCQASFTHTTSGLTASLNNTSTGTGPGTSYSWNMGNGGTAFGQNPSYTYSQAGAYVVCLTISDSNSNCFSTYCDTVVVSSTGSNCQASFTHTTSGLTASFTNTSTGTGPGTYYYYNMGNGTFISGQNPNYTYSQAGTYVVCLTISDSSTNCQSTYCDTVVVSSSGGGNCQALFSAQISGGMVFFTNLSTPNNGAITWSWSMGDGTNLWTKNPVHTYQNAGTYVACLTMYDSLNNCQSSYCDTLVIQNTMPCQAKFTIIQDSLNPNTYNYINQSSPAFGLTYSWIFSDGTVFNTKHVTRTYTTPGTYTACLYITDSINQCSDSTCMSITINPPVPCNAMFTHSINGKVASFVNQSVPNNGSLSYSWNFGDGSAGSSAQHPVHTYANYGTYHVCLTIVDSNTNCWDTYCDTLVLSAPIPCVADFSVVDSGNGYFLFFNQSTPMSQLNHYSWTFGDGNSAITKDAQHQYSAPGAYTVCLYVEDTTTGCSDSICKTVSMNALGINNYDLSSAVKVFPNPFENQIQLSWSVSLEEVSIRIFDLTGKGLLLQTDLPVEQGSTHTLDLSSYSLSSGVYYLEVSTGQDKSTYPIYKR